jgi:hypothetical protein
MSKHKIPKAIERLDAKCYTCDDIETNCADLVVPHAKISWNIVDCLCTAVIGTTGTYFTLLDCEGALSESCQESWNCINGNCIDPGDGSGTYATLSACQSECRPRQESSWNCINGNCIDPGDGLGMYTTLLACQSECRPRQESSWNCVDGNCIDPGDGSGTYTTLSACQSECKTRQESSWNCVDGNCIDPGDGSGTYTTLSACQSECKPRFPSSGCTDPLAINYNPLAVDDDGSCLYGLGNLPMGEHNMGVMTPNKLPINGDYWTGSVDAAICVYPPSPGSPVYGSHITKNYNPNASLFQHQGGLVYTESHYWNLGGLTPGNTYTLKWKEIVLALRTVTQCSDCLMGGWAVRISAYNPVNWYLYPTPSYNDLNLATPIYDPITNGTLSYASSLYHDSNCNQNTSQTTTNTAGAPNGSESEWNDRSTTFTTYAPNLRIHFIAYTDFNLCTNCHHDTIAQGQSAISTHGSYVGLSELELI